jgi:hypothetical protein
MPDTRAHDEVYRPDGGLQWVASQRIHSAGCQHLDLAKRPSQIDDDQLLWLVPWLADGGVRRQAARDQFGGSRPKVPPGRPGPLSMGARVGPSSRPEPEPTKPEPEPPPQPTKPPEPEPPKPRGHLGGDAGQGGADWLPAGPRDRDRAAGGGGRRAGRLVAHRPVLARRRIWWATGISPWTGPSTPPSSAGSCVP